MNLLDTSADRVHASVIQRAQMEAESLAAFARKNGLALKVDIEPQRDQVIVVRDAATPAPTMVDEQISNDELAMLIVREVCERDPADFTATDSVCISVGDLESIVKGRLELREQEGEEDAYVISRLSNVLAEVAIALKGEQRPLHRHSFHDLAEVARTLKLELDLYRASFPNGVPDSATRPTLQSLGGDAGVISDLRSKLTAAANYIDTLGGNSKSYRYALSLTSTEKSDGTVGDMPKYVSDAEWEAGNSTLPAAPKAAEKSGRSE